MPFLTLQAGAMPLHRRIAARGMVASVFSVFCGPLRIRVVCAYIKEQEQRLNVLVVR